MKLKQVTEVIWRFSHEGRPKASQRSYSREDIAQMVRFSFSNSIRNQYWSAKRKGQKDYHFLSPLLVTKKFELGKSNSEGRRIAKLNGMDMFRLPENEHISTVIPSGECSDSNTTITQVQPGEERFYIGPAFETFQFYVIANDAIETYHLPECVKDIEVKGAFDMDGDTDLTDDTAFEVAMNILGLTLRIPGFVNSRTDNPYETPKSQQLKRSLQQPQESGGVE